MSGSSLIGLRSALNISTPTVIAQGGPAGNPSMRVGRVSVTAGGASVGMVYDAATPGGAIAANAIAMIPAAVGITVIDFPCVYGILFAPGTGMTASVSYDA